MKRRNFMKWGAMLGAGAGVGLAQSAIAAPWDFSDDEDSSADETAIDDMPKERLPSAKSVLEGTPWIMPDEGEAHAATWMSFGVNEDIWGERLTPQVQADLVAVAKTIAKYEPVFMLTNSYERELLEDLVNAHDNITIVEHPVNDLWIRDTGPTFVTNKDHKKFAGIDFNFNGWGRKQSYDKDETVANFVTNYTKVPTIKSSLHLEGGALEVDGEGTAIITESCVLNDNRNPGRSKESIEKELKHLLGLEKIIWLPGIKGKDITDGHTDFYARFVRPGFVLANLDNFEDGYDYKVTRDHLAILKKATDAKGRKLKIETLSPPDDVPSKWLKDASFAAGYINYYVGNGFVILPKFQDDAADKKAYKTLKNAYPDRTIEQVEIFGIASGGGGIHCSTQQQIKF